MKFKKPNLRLDFLENKAGKKAWKRFVKFMSAVVVFVTTYALILPAITLETSAHCGQNEHTHGDQCWTVEKTLICEKEETEGHAHDESCYSEKTDLICDNKDPDHQHGPECYRTTEELTCRQEETEAHHHSEDCWKEEKKLTCTREEHEHEPICYSDPEADIETQEDWEKTMKDVKLTGNWDEDVVYIAKSQIGYEESTKNFEIDKETNEKKGYTRYGEWFGKPYGDWSTYFLAFSLNYAGISEEDLPYMEETPDKFAERLEKAKMEITPNFGEAKKGDLVFFKNENTSKEQTYSGVGIIENVVNDEKELVIITGGISNKVEHKNYKKTDEKLSFLKLPDNQNPGFKATTVKKAARTSSSQSSDSSNGGVALHNSSEGDSDSENDEPEGEPQAYSSENRTDLQNSLKSVKVTDAVYDPAEDAILSEMHWTFDIKRSDLDNGNKFELKIPDKIIPTELLNKNLDLTTGEGGQVNGHYRFVQRSDGYYLEIDVNQDFIDSTESNMPATVNFQNLIYSKHIDNEGKISIPIGNGQTVTLTTDDYRTSENESVHYDVDSKKSAVSTQIEDGKLTYKVLIWTKKGTGQSVEFEDVIAFPNGVTVNGEPEISVSRVPVYAQNNTNQIQEFWEKDFLADNKVTVTPTSKSYNYDSNSRKGSISLTLPELNGFYDAETRRPDLSAVNKSHYPSNIPEDWVRNAYIVTYTYDINIPEGMSPNISNGVTITGGSPKEPIKDGDSTNGTIIVAQPSLWKGGSAAKCSDGDIAACIPDPNLKVNPDYPNIKWQIAFNSNNLDVSEFVMTDEAFKTITCGGIGIFKEAPGINRTKAEEGKDFELIYEDGKIAQIKFLKQEGGNRYRYTIEYCTDRKPDWLGKPVSNEVIAGKPGKGPVSYIGVFNPEKASIEKTADPNPTIHIKDSGGKTQILAEVDWTVNINVPYSEVPDKLVIEDDLPEEMWMTYDWVDHDKGTVNILDKNGNRLVTLTPYHPEDVEHEYLMLYDSNDQKWHHCFEVMHNKQVYQNHKFTKFRFTFSTDYFPEYFNIWRYKWGKIQFKFHTMADVTETTEKEKLFTNSLNANGAEGTGTWTYHGNELIKRGWKDNDGIVWEVLARLHSKAEEETEPTSLTLQDTLPFGIDLVDLTILDMKTNQSVKITSAEGSIDGSYDFGSFKAKVKYQDNQAAAKDQISVIIEKNGSSDLTLFDREFKLTYHTSIDTEEIEGFGKSKSETFVNEIKFYKDDELVDQNKTEVKWDHNGGSSEGNKVSKTGVYNKDNHLIHYEVTIDGRDVDDSIFSDDEEKYLELSDRLEYQRYDPSKLEDQTSWRKKLTLIQNSVKIYEINGSSKTEISKDSWSDEERNLDYSETVNRYNKDWAYNDLSIRLPIGKKLVVEYDYSILVENDPGNLQLNVNNTANVKEIGNSNRVDRWDYYQKPTSSGTIGANGLFIHKVERGTNQPIKDTEFTLEEYDPKSKEYFVPQVNGNDVTFKTDDEGIIKLQLPDNSTVINGYEFKYNTAYRLVESKSAPGYINEKQKIEFYFKQGKGGGSGPHLDSAESTLLTISILHLLLMASRKL